MRVPFLPLVAPLFLAASLAAQAKEAVDFEKQIWPIFEKRCIECHATAHTGPDGKLKKPKGGVTLDNKDGIIASKKGKLVVAKKPDDSLLYAAITLPADDEDRMPPEKKGEPLSAEQTALIRKWIEGGADFGKWSGKKAEEADKGRDKGDKPAEGDKGGTKGGEKSGGKTSRVDPLPGLQRGVQALPAATLAPFANGPFRVASIGDDSPLLAVACVGQVDSIDDRAVAALAPLAEHVAELDLSRTKVGDAGCAVIAKMKRLVALDLRQTQVGDHGVAALATCTELRSLNLFGTKTGDYGLAALAALKRLEHLYVWQTEVGASAIVRLREGTPGLRIVMAPDLPEPMAEGAPGARRRR